MNNCKGSALIASLVIGFLCLSLIFAVSHWTWFKSLGDTHRLAAQRAFDYADSGVKEALRALEMPDMWAVSTSTDVESTRMVRMPMPHGAYAYTLTFDSTTPSLVDLYATGYYELAQGSTLDPVTNRPAQRSVIHAKVRTLRVTDVLVAVSGTLRIGSRTMAEGGSLYAQNLVFAQGLEGEALLKTQMPYTAIDSAFYSQRAERVDGTPDPSPPNVYYTSNPPYAQQEHFPLNLPPLDASMQKFYQDQATSPSSRLDSGTTLEGMLEKPPGSPNSVYFCDGDLTLAAQTPVMVRGFVVVYVTGQVVIHNTIQAKDDTSWLVLLAGKDIHITDDAPTDLELDGTFLTNGAIVADGPPDSSRSLTFRGNIVAPQGLDLAAHWGSSRTYTYIDREDPTVLLPRLTQLLEYTIVEGKYNQ
jgi:hypothetical protein